MELGAFVLLASAALVVAEMVAKKLGDLALAMVNPIVVDSEGIDLEKAAVSNLDRISRKSSPGLHCNLHSMGSALLTLPSIFITV